MNQHTSWRLEIAREIAPAYIANQHIEAVFVFGSVGRGLADMYSDIELGIIWKQAPTDGERREAALGTRAERLELAPFDEAKHSWADMFYKRGIRVEVVHWTIEAVESIIAAVIEQFDVSQNFLVFEKQALLSSLQSAVVLHDESLMAKWRQRIAVYPEALAVAMVQKHLRFSAFGSREMLAARNEVPLLYENNSHSVRLLLNLLFGLNRLYHPTFKWTSRFATQMTIAPANLFTRIEKVYRADAVTGTNELRSLIEETLDLVEKHLPQIDLTAQRAEFVRPYESWMPPHSK